MTAAFAPAFISTSLVRMSTRSCRVATRFFCVAIVSRSLSRSAVFCVRSASKAATFAANCPRSAARTRGPRARATPAPSPSGQSIAGRGIEAMRPRAQERGLAAQDFRPRGSKLGARAFGVGQGGRAVELDQNLARAHKRAVADENGLDPAGFQGLDDLDLSGRLKLALRGGDDVDAAEIGPGEGARRRRRR